MLHLAILVGLGIISLAPTKLSADTNAKHTITAELQDRLEPLIESEIMKFLKMKEAQVSHLSKEKGHDPNIYRKIVSLQNEIEAIRADLATKFKVGADIPREIHEDLKFVEKILKTLNKREASDATTFPAACGNASMTKNLSIQKGIIEKSKGQWVLSKADENSPEGVLRIKLSDEVGLFGSSINDPVVKTNTRQGYYVEGYVDPNANAGKGAVMCVSKEKKVDTKVSAATVTAN